MSRARRLGSDLFAVPPFEEDDNRRSAAVLRAVLLVQVVAVSFYGPAVHQLAPLSTGEQAGMVAYVALLLFALACVTRGALRVASAVTITAQVAFSLAGAVANVSSGGTAGLFLAVMLGGQVFGARGAFVVGLTALTGLAGIAIGAGGPVPMIGLSPQRIAAGVIVQLATATTLVVMASRSSIAMLRRLRAEQKTQTRLNTDLARRVADGETLVAIGRVLVEGEAIDNAVIPAIELLSRGWGQPVVLFGRGPERPTPLAMSGFRSAVLVGGDDEAARVVAEEEVTDVVIVDSARTGRARAVGVRTGTVPHGILVASVEDTLNRPAAEADGLLQGAAALLAAAFEWRETAGRLRAAERRRAALVKSSPDAFLIVEEHGTIIDANPAALRLLSGHPPLNDADGLVGRSLGAIDAIGADDLKRITRTLSESRAGRPTAQLDMTLRYDEQRSAHVELRVIYSIDDGRGRFDVAFRDVTARVEADRQRERLEAQLFAARRLEALGQLAGGVAHDFNNLLSVILTNARLLAERQDMDVTAREDLKEIVDCGRRAADLTSQLLTFARQQRREPRVLDVNAAVRGVEKLLRRLIPTNIALMFDLTPDPWPILVDPAQLEQILVNLVANARDAMESGGQCAITTRNVMGPASVVDEGLSPGRYVELTVSDTGGGMDAETKAHVFEPFFTTKPLGRGSGLGLATVYGIVKQSGGHITVESARGQGSVFRVYLPYAAFADDDEHTPAVGDALSAGRERILVVDDDEAVRRATERALVSRGFTVLVARSPREALGFSGEAFDAVVVDLVMPELGGDDLVVALREQRPDLPAVLLTGYGRKSVELGRPFRLLRKPASPEELARSVRAVIDEAVVGRRDQPT